LPVYSQYTFNKFLLNPAAAGVDGYTSISLVAREQWVGFKGTPKTHAITIDSRLLRNSYISKNINPRKRFPVRKVGWAAHAFNDHGTADRTGVERYLCVSSDWMRTAVFPGYQVCFTSSGSTRIR
jgi:hypothetical protein